MNVYPETKGLLSSRKFVLSHSQRKRSQIYVILSLIHTHIRVHTRTYTYTRAFTPRENTRTHSCKTQDSAEFIHLRSKKKKKNKTEKQEVFSFAERFLPLATRVCRESLRERFRAMSATSQRRRPGKLASCTVDFVSREFPFPTIQPTTSPRRRRGGFSLVCRSIRRSSLLALNSPNRLFDRSPLSPHLPPRLIYRTNLSRALDSVRPNSRLTSIDNVHIHN